MKLRPGVLLAFAFVMILTTMTSCVRKYYCQCEITYSGQAGLPKPHINEYEIKDTKKKAEQLCNANSGEYTNGDIKTKESCQLY
jgi:hypothetical protein